MLPVTKEFYLCKNSNMKNLLLLLAILLTLTSHGQGMAPVPSSQLRGTSEILGGLKIDSICWLPVRPLTDWQYANAVRPFIGALQVNPVDSLPYFMKKSGVWYRLLSQNDTPSFQKPITLTTAGTSGAATFISNILNIPNYSSGGGTGTVTNVSTGYGLSGGPITTTGTIIADSNLLATRLRLQKVSDSLAAIIATKGSGTVTQVNNGYGITGGPITTTGSLGVDSTLLATRLRVQKSIDSLSAIIATKGTVTSVGAVAGTGINIAGTSPITSAGTFTFTNTAPDQTVTIGAGTGISIGGSYPTFTVTNTSPSSGGTVTGVSGTANRITSTGGTTPVIDISAAYVGQTSITTLGTVTTGTWSTGAVISGATMTLSSDASFDMYYRNSSGVLTRLGNGTTGQLLTATTASAPSWASPATAGTVTSVSVVTANGMAGAVANATTTPAITLTTTVNSPVLAGNGTAISAATTTGTGSTVVLSAAPTITGHPTIEGVTSTGATGTGNLVFSAATTLTGTTIASVLNTSSSTTLGSGTGNLTITIGGAATLSGSTTAITIGANGASGSTKSVTIGSVAAGVTSTTTINNLVKLPTICSTATLTAGTVAVTITGITTSSVAHVTLITPSGTLGTGGYKAVCTANTLTITSVSTLGALNNLDASTVGYVVFNF